MTQCVNNLTPLQVIYSPNKDIQDVETKYIRDYLVNKITNAFEQLNIGNFINVTGQAIIIHLDKEQIMLMKLILPEDIVLRCPYQ